MHTDVFHSVDTIKLSRRQLESGGVREQKVAEVICENKHFCSATMHFEAFDRWLARHKPSGKTVVCCLMLFRVICNYATVVTGKGFSLK